MTHPPRRLVGAASQRPAPPPGQRLEGARSPGCWPCYVATNTWSTPIRRPARRRRRANSCAVDISHACAVPVTRRWRARKTAVGAAEPPGTTARPDETGSARFPAATLRALTTEVSQPLLRTSETRARSRRRGWTWIAGLMRAAARQLRSPDASERGSLRCVNGDSQSNDPHRERAAREYQRRLRAALRVP